MNIILFLGVAWLLALGSVNLTNKFVRQPYKEGDAFYLAILAGNFFALQFIWFYIFNRIQ